MALKPLAPKQLQTEGAVAQVGEHRHAKVSIHVTQQQRRQDSAAKQGLLSVWLTGQQHTMQTSAQLPSRARLGDGAPHQAALGPQRAPRLGRWHRHKDAAGQAGQVRLQHSGGRASDSKGQLMAHLRMNQRPTGGRCAWVADSRIV